MAATFDKELAHKLCNLEKPNRIKFSPDGTRVAYSTALAWGQRVGKNAVSTIWLASTDGQDRRGKLPLAPPTTQSQLGSRMAVE